jgi:hypothetical protein
VVARDRTIRYLYKGQDFADRPGDSELLDALVESNLTKGVDDATR